MSRIDNFIRWIDDQISAYSPEVKNLNDACDRVKGINERVSAVLKNKQSNFDETATNAAALTELKQELDVEVKLIEENKDSGMVKLLKGFHNLFKQSTPVDQYSDTQSLEAVKGKIDFAISKRQNVLSVAPELEELFTRKPLQPIVINDSINGLQKEANTLDEAIEKLEALKVEQQALPNRLNVLEEQKQELEQRIDVISNQLSKSDKIGNAYLNLGKAPQAALKLKGQLKKDLKSTFAQFEKVIDAQEKLNKGKSQLDLDVASLETTIKNSPEWQSLSKWPKVSKWVYKNTLFINDPNGLLRREAKNKDETKEKSKQLEIINGRLEHYKDLPALSEAFIAYAKSENKLSAEFPSDPKKKMDNLKATVEDLLSQ